jgi:hypothetical protein
MEITIPANECCVDGHRGRSNPEVALIERKAAALLSSFDISIPVSG